MITDGVLANAANFNAAFESKNKQVRSVTSSGAVNSTDYLIEANCSGGAITMTLPQASLNSGRVLIFKKVDASVNLLTLDGNSTELVGGQLTMQLIGINQTAKLICDGAEWMILSNQPRWPNSALEPMYNITAATYNLTPWDDHVRINTNASGTTVNLPAVSDLIRGKQYRILRRAGDLNDVLTIATNGSDVINYHGISSVSSVKLMTTGESILLEAAVGGWVIVDRYIPSAWIQYSATIGGFSGTPSQSFWWRRVGDSIEIKGKISKSAATYNGVLTFTLPSGLTLDTARMEASTYAMTGRISCESTVGNYHGILFQNNASTTTMVAFGDSNLGVWTGASSVPVSSASLVSFQIDCSCAITNWEG